jgi:hypothetical protein
MFNQLTYKTKIIYLGIAFVMFLFLSFKLAINKTIDLKKQCTEIEKRMDQLKTAPQQMAIIKSKLQVIDSQVGGKRIDQINLEELIIEHISTFCKYNNLVLKEYPGIHQFKQQDYLTETCKVTVEGSFIRLLRLANDIERNFSYGKVSSLNFYLQKNFSTKKNELLMEIYVQNIKIIKE